MYSWARTVQDVHWRYGTRSLSRIDLGWTSRRCALTNVLHYEALTLLKPENLNRVPKYFQARAAVTKIFKQQQRKSKKQSPKYSQFEKIVKANFSLQIDNRFPTHFANGTDTVFPAHLKSTHDLRPCDLPFHLLHHPNHFSMNKRKHSRIRLQLIKRLWTSQSITTVGSNNYNHSMRPSQSINRLSIARIASKSCTTWTALQVSSAVKDTRCWPIHQSDCMSARFVLNK